MSKAIHTNISYETPERRNMNKDDRRNFIDHLFDVFEILDKSSKKQTAKQITAQYKEEHPDLKLNEMWVYRLYWLAFIRMMKVSMVLTTLITISMKCLVNHLYSKKH